MIEPIMKALQGQRFPLEAEKATQTAIDDVLKATGLRVEREVECGKGFIDFVVTVSEPFPPPLRGFRVRRVGIEVKIKGAMREIARQIDGYSRAGTLDAIILVTSKPVSFPRIAFATPLHVFNMARAWL